jgi:hypothetical protein
MAKTIWENYLFDVSKSRVNLGKETISQLKTVWNQGPPYPSNFFDNAGDEILNLSLSQPFLQCVRNFADSALYAYLFPE